MYDVVTIGDAMKDVFLFPALDEMRKPIDGGCISARDKNKEFLVFELGDKVTISQTYESLGGTACNVAVGLSRLKLKTALISAIGKDQAGEELTEKLKKEKVDTSLIKTYLSRGTSFSDIISYKGERTILVKHNFEPNDFNLPNNLETDWLYVGPLGSDYKKTYAKITGLAVQKNIKIALNPGAVQIHDGLRTFGGLLGVAKIIFLNREEAEILTGLTGITTVKELALTLRKTGVEVVVITDGNKGSYVSFENDFVRIGNFPARRVEATGAGDAFASGFLAAYIKNLDILACLKWGAINGGSVVSQYGAQQGLLTVHAIEIKAKEYHWPASELRFA